MNGSKVVSILVFTIQVKIDSKEQLLLLYYTITVSNTLYYTITASESLDKVFTITSQI